MTAVGQGKTPAKFSWSRSPDDPCTCQSFLIQSRTCPEHGHNAPRAVDARFSNLDLGREIEDVAGRGQLQLGLDAHLQEPS